MIDWVINDGSFAKKSDISGGWQPYQQTLILDLVDALQNNFAELISSNWVIT